MELSKRGKEIVKILYHSEGPLTSKKIAKEIHVSMRTVQYELRDVEDWASENEIEIEIKQHIGIRLLDKKKVKTILEEMDDENEKIIIPTNDERVQMILLKLLEEKEPIRVKEFMKNLDVSKTTILKDLEKVEKYLEGHKIRYVRNKNGIVINDGEDIKRNEILRLIYENVEKAKLIEYFFHSDFFMMRQKKNYTIEKYVDNLMKDIDLADVKLIICLIQEQLKIQLSDLSFVGLIIHFALSIKRIKHNQPVQFDIPEEEKICQMDEYKIIQKIVHQLEEKYCIQFPKSEMCYLVMHFITSQVTKSEIFQDNELSDELIHILVDECKKEYGIDLSLDEELIQNLRTHLYPAIMRMKYGVSIYNPILKMIKEQYPESFLVCRRAAKRFQDECHIQIEDHEAGYLATYVELGLDQLGYRRKDNIYRTVVVCSMGLGISKILTQRVEHEFSNIEVVEQLSAMEIESYDFFGIDFILSTVDISATVAKPIIIINPMMNREDIRKISDFMLENGNQDIKVIQFTKILDIVKETCLIQNESRLENSLKKIMGLKNNIVVKKRFLDILTPQLCTCQIEADTWEEAVKIAAKPLLEQEYIKKSYLEEILKTQKMFSHYYIIGNEVSMPHAAPESGVNKLGFALGTLKYPIKIQTKKQKEQKIRVILILAAIDKVQHTEALTDITNLLDMENSVNQLTNPMTSQDLYKKIKELLEVN